MSLSWEKFSALLEEHLESFREYAHIQEQLATYLKEKRVVSIATLHSEINNVSQKLASERLALKPYLEQWAQLSAKERADLRSGKINDALDKIEVLAKHIENQHTESLSKEESVLQGSTIKSVQDNSSTSIADRLYLYR